MSGAGDDDANDDGLAALTTAVKSRILERVLADLRVDLRLGSAMNGYTRSDSGIYGKYQKQDVDLAAMLEAVRRETDRLLAEYERGAGDAPAEVERDGGEVSAEADRDGASRDDGDE